MKQFKCSLLSIKHFYAFENRKTYKKKFWKIEKFGISHKNCQTLRFYLKLSKNTLGVQSCTTKYVYSKNTTISFEYVSIYNFGQKFN